MICFVFLGEGAKEKPSKPKGRQLELHNFARTLSFWAALGPIFLEHIQKTYVHTKNKKCNFFQQKMRPNKKVEENKSALELMQVMILNFGVPRGGVPMSTLMLSSLQDAFPKK